MEPEKKSNGALIGSIIIIIILVIGAIYIWQTQSKKTEEPKNTEVNTAITESDTNELNSLDQDLSTTDTSTGVDVNAIQ